MVSRILTFVKCSQISNHKYKTGISFSLYDLNFKKINNMLFTLY